MFDGLPEKFDPLVFSPGKEGLRKLSMLLRIAMPMGFKWRFNVAEIKAECGTVGCAIGLARAVWPECRPMLPVFHGASDSSRVASTFAMPLEAARAIFFNRADIYNKWDSDVTPADVADAIDRYLATGKAS